MPLVEKLRTQRTRLPRVIVYCRTHSDCGTLYELFRLSLGKEFTEPKGLPDVSEFRLVDMFTSATQQQVKDNVIKLFCKESRLRIVICTIAFGMGIDCADVRQVVHWGPSKDVEGYMQEVGRAGRDGKKSCALLFWSKKDISSQLTDQQMIDYCKGKDCRRNTLLQYFDKACSYSPNCSGCSCCDMCFMKCMCHECNLKPFPLLPNTISKML